MNVLVAFAYENRRAMPRAWLVRQAIEVSDQEALASIRYSQLPDGRPFDPTHAALVEQGSGGAWDRGDGNVRVTAIDDGRIALDVSSTRGGYLVLSEAYYPGWRATIDGRQEPVRRTNFMFQGVPVPAGQHKVVFELVSTSLRIGTIISLAAYIAAASLAWRG